MARYTANRTVKTLTIHKPDCRCIPSEKLSSCGCGDTGQTGEQRWWCETHLTTNEINEFMRGKFWAIVLCDTCCRN